MLGVFSLLLYKLSMQISMVLSSGRIFLSLDKCLKGLNSSAVKFSDGSWSLGKLSYQDQALPSNLAFIKRKSSVHKFFRFTSRNNNPKGSKNSEYLIELGFTEREHK